MRDLQRSGLWYDLRLKSSIGWMPAVMTHEYCEAMLDWRNSALGLRSKLEFKSFCIWFVPVVQLDRISASEAEG